MVKKNKFPKKLVDLYKELVRTKFDDDEIYEKYKKEANKFLGRNKKDDRLETGKLIVQLHRYVREGD
jgi:hypothetical protein